ncbi:bactofilin family protein [Thermospira aquatica]|uniref:Polymer-forming cytoskeletal protein n=1 Tax=Thermospira aquatica TaxID=2828656 RepID=A0AAX3BFL4_9SPIR|nr:polymer-forming cytoskeletal protein [Thermospira aquatica]URA11202.1 polymer-forming cytoskeletal protein [Thermospira aquatica]
MANEEIVLSGSVNDEQSNSVIGRDNCFSGEMRSDGLLRIDGDYCGVIRGYGVVVVGQHGRIKGDIYARKVRIGGKVKGTVYALERVDILSTGKLVGDMYTKRCQLEEGMCFTGKGNILPEQQLEEIFTRQVKNTPKISMDDF